MGPYFSGRFHFESLETRTMLSAFTVTSIADPATLAPNTLRWAVAQANAAGGSNTINFDPTTFAAGSLHIITLAQGPLNLAAGDITISGPSPATIAVSGNSTSGIFQIAAGVTANIIGLTITAGHMTAGGGSNGGAIDNNGTVNIITCAISGNTAAQNGGGIYNDGNLTLNTSTVSGNSATTAGGGLFNDGTMTVINSTIASNSAPIGGGFYAHAGAATIFNGTIAGNSATSTGNDIYINNANAGTLAINNTIVAGKLLGGDIAGTLVPSSSYNLIDDTTGGLANGVGGAIGNLLNTGAALRSLSNNGGPTATMALLPGSPAIDAGSNGLTSGATTDQRGYIRIANATVDIGAYEFAAAPPNIAPVVNSTADDVDYLPGTLTLRQAISLAEAQPSGGIITFDPTVFAAGVMHTITPTQGALTFTAASSTLSGPAASLLTIDGQRDSGQSVLNITSAASATITGVTITGSNAGGIANSGNLTISGCDIYNNSASSGGAVYNTGTLAVISSSLAGNSAFNSGGGIYNSATATATVTGSNVTGNDAPLGGGVNNSGNLTLSGVLCSSNSANNSGGGIDNAGSVSINNSTLASNTATSQGGGLFNSAGSASIINCTLVGNSAAAGGGINITADPVTLYNTIVAGSPTGGDLSGLPLNAASSNDLIDDSSSGLSGNSNITNVPANLGPLADNGGPTYTYALLSGSSAINAGNNSFVPAGTTSDQRGTGFPRVTGGLVDIGAFEAGAFATVTALTSSASLINYGQGVTFTATVTSASGSPTGSVTFFDITTGSTLGTSTISGSTASLSTGSYILPAGPNTISATYGISGNFNASTGSFIQNVLPAPLTITTNPQTKTYGSINPAFTGSISGLVGSDSITATYGTTATQFNNAGSYPITATLSDPGNKLGSYTVNYVTGQLTIGKANQTIAWTTPAAIASGTAIGSAQLNATASGIPGGSAPGTLTYTPGIGALLSVGNQLLTATAAATANYNATTASVAVRVILAPAVGSVPPSATFLGVDTTTQGNWQTNYGADGYTIIDNKINNPAYATVTDIGGSYYAWPLDPTDPRALELAGDYGSRIAASRYTATTMTIDLNLTDDSTHQVSLYLLDADSSSRSERIDILNASNPGMVLSSQTVSSFHGGQYLTWTLGGHVQIVITNLNPASNAVISGLFFGSTTFLGADTATQGDWSSAFGTDGQLIANTPAVTPAYAAVSVAGATPYTWSVSTPNGSALQQSGGAGIASAWYAPSSMTFDVNLTDGQKHIVALYLLDWDDNGRSERVDILDSFGNILNTQAASSFSGGEYLSWNLSGHVQIKVTNLAGTNAVVSGLFFSTPTFLGTDTTTEGAWKTQYGADGQNIVDHAITGIATVYPSYATVTAFGNSDCVWSPSTTDPRALQQIGATVGIASAWYTSTTMTFDINLTDGKAHRVSLYALDWDSTTRAERIDILDASGNLLDSESISAFQSGVYLTWKLAGHIQIVITNTGPSNAVISGLFFDPVPFVRTDTTTQGNWQGKYGTDGYNAIGNAASYPTYALVTPTGNTPYTWNATADSRALQTPGSGTTNAAAWYTTTVMTIDVNLTDLHSHQVSLYLLDWGDAGRTERIDILDPSGTLLDSQTVSNFQNGIYLTWTLRGDNQFRITTLAGGNAVVSGIFFDSATFLGTDTTTQGNWQGVYGADGQIVPNNVTANPSYATFSSAGATAYTWSPTTTDPRALRQPYSVNAIASAWYTPTSMTIDLNLTDGILHKISLYLLDFDDQSRSERIDILDAQGNVLDTETASSFQNGEYLSWNLSGQIQIRITCLTGPNAVLNGLFFG
jgi:hypothetical protein